MKPFISGKQMILNKRDGYRQRKEEFF